MSRRKRPRTPTPGHYLGLKNDRDHGGRDRDRGSHYGRDDYGDRRSARRPPLRGRRDYSPPPRRERSRRDRSYSPYGSPERRRHHRGSRWDVRKKYAIIGLFFLETPRPRQLFKNIKQITIIVVAGFCKNNHILHFSSRCVNFNPANTTLEISAAAAIPFSCLWLSVAAVFNQNIKEFSSALALFSAAAASFGVYKTNMPDQCY